MATRARGRPRKPRESRMDAAVDAMKNFGFEEKLVKQTVKELLKVYGGPDSWPLIEDGCYATLLEILLKKNAEEEGGSARADNGTQPDEEGGTQPEQTMVLEQNLDTTPAAGNTEPEPPNDGEPPFSDITDNASGNDNTGTVESPRGDGNLDAPAINCDVNLEGTNIDLPQAILPPQVPAETIANQRRKPCYGWLSEEDEDRDGIVYVPARLPEPEKPRRKSRWDVKPDGI